MTVRSKQQRSAAMSAKILELPATRKASSVNAVSLHSRPRSNISRRPLGASLLSIRQHLTYKATMGVTELEFIEQSYSAQVANKIVAHVRELLDHEFGPLRVHRHRQTFVVSHHCKESLVAGLLRVQFHSRQIPLPATRGAEGFSDMCGVLLSWGVGQTLPEAEAERLEKQRN